MIEKSNFQILDAPKKSVVPKEKRRGSRFERHRVARLMAVQAMYQAHQTKTPYHHVTETFLDYHFKNHDHPLNPDRELFLHLMKVLETHEETIQEILEKNLMDTWNIENLDSVLRSILTVGIGELIAPYKETSHGVIISEYVEVAKGFFENKEAGYVNKALDSISKKLR